MEKRIRASFNKSVSGVFTPNVTIEYVDKEDMPLSEEHINQLEELTLKADLAAHRLTLKSKARQ